MITLKPNHKAVKAYYESLKQFGSLKVKQRFIRALAYFVELCRHSINPHLSEKAVEEMLMNKLAE